MFGLDPDVGNSALRLWVAAGSAALLVFVCALAFDWTRTRTVARVSVVVVGAILGGTLAWAFLNAAGARDRAAERRDLETRAAQLNIRALQPGSPLACLDGLSGDNVEAACERALFASPVSVATATTYVAARLALLADMTTYVQRGGGNIDTALVPLRRGLETDRFGFVAHTLAKRDGCSSEKCKALVAALRSEQGTRQSQRPDARPLSRSLYHRLGAGARHADRRSRAVRADDGCGANPRAQRAAQARQYRFPVRGFDPRGQHHESGAERPGHAAKRGGRGQCRPAVERQSGWADDHAADAGATRRGKGGVRQQLVQEQAQAGR